MINTLKKYWIYAVFCLWILCIGYLFGLFRSNNIDGNISIDINKEIELRAKNLKTGQGKGELPSSLESNFFGSMNGTKYYPKSCSGSKRIKDDNRIWFESETEAEEAGYTISKGC